MDNEKKIEIPFGAFDSELIHQEINIPNGFNAVIDGNKIILTRAESEDERIRKSLIEMVHDTPNSECEQNYNVRKEDCLSWLEKQGEQKPDEWSEEDERMCQETIDWFEKKCFPYALESENPARESIKWLKSLKQRIGG